MYAQQVKYLGRTGVATPAGRNKQQPTYLNRTWTKVETVSASCWTQALQRLQHKAVRSVRTQQKFVLLLGSTTTLMRRELLGAVRAERGGQLQPQRPEVSESGKAVHGESGLASNSAGQQVCCRSNSAARKWFHLSELAAVSCRCST